MAKMTTEEFIARAREKFGDKYDYSKVNYVDVDTNVTIICPVHGEFQQTPYCHLKSNGCPECYKTVLSERRRKENEQLFLQKAKEKFGDKYDYSKVNYVNNSTDVTIICPIHGEFQQKPAVHIRPNSTGCPECGNELKILRCKDNAKTTEEFIEKARETHEDKYDYSKVNYVNAKTKVCIICHEKDEFGEEHGEFYQLPYTHLNGAKCPKCTGHAKFTTEDFVKKARAVHGDKYDYSKVEYKDNKTAVCIICPEHGKFWQRPYSHMIGAQCPDCVHPSRKKTTEEFIADARAIHGDKYDYSKTEYINKDTDVCVICPTHGKVWVRPATHLNGCGCPRCSKVSNLEDFVLKANEVHKNKYEYSKVKYVDSRSKVCIICPKHGKFWQRPNEHLVGKGCPLCNHGLTKQYKFNLLEEFESEYAFRAFLENHDINILLSILMNIEPKYEPLKKDIERALAHANEVNPIQSLREKYSSDTEESDGDDYIEDTNTTDTDNFDWDNDDEVNDMISQESETETDTDNELTIEDIIRNDEEEIRVINRLDSEHLITPEVREYIKAKYKNDMMRAWMAKRDDK